MCFSYQKVKKTFSNHFCYFYKVTGHALFKFENPLLSANTRFLSPVLRQVEWDCRWAVSGSGEHSAQRGKCQAPLGILLCPPERGFLSLASQPLAGLSDDYGPVSAPNPITSMTAS